MSNIVSILNANNNLANGLKSKIRFIHYRNGTFDSTCSYMVAVT